MNDYIEFNDFADYPINNPITDGIILRRFPDGIETNIPHLVTHHSPAGYEWGYGGSGPADLALNILENALAEMGHEGGRTNCWNGTCWTLSWKLHQKFKREFLVSFSKDGGVIEWSVVRDWITKEMQKL